MPLWRKISDGTWHQRLVFRRDSYAKHVKRDASGNIVLDENNKPVYMTVGSNLKNTGTMSNKPLFNKYYRLYYTDRNGKTQLTGWKPIYKYALVQTSPEQAAKERYMIISDCMGNITTAGTGGVFTACSAICGNTGVRTRKFKCVRMESNRDSAGSYTYTDVTDDYCTKAGIKLNSSISDSTGTYDSRTSDPCNREECKLYYYGGVDDDMEVWAKSDPSHGWTLVKRYSGFGGSAKHNTCCAEKISNVTPFSGSTAYVKIKWRDDAGGSTGSTALMLRICKDNPAPNGCISCSTSQPNCSGWIVNSGYLRHYSSSHTTFLWFKINMNDLSFTRSACSHVSDNKYNKYDYASGGSKSACGNYKDRARDRDFGTHACCQGMGWGYLNCGLGEPF